LETDRGAVLTCRAAARGAIDFTKANVRDLSWWRMTNAVISSMARTEEIVALQAAYDFQLALVGNSGLTEESFKASQKTGKEIFQQIIDTQMPWAAADLKGQKDREVNSLIDAYKRMIGDPDDPEFQKKLLHDMELQDKPKVVVKKESEEDRIARLIEERDKHYEQKGMKPGKRR
jgi:hypothetical protein